MRTTFCLAAALAAAAGSTAGALAQTGNGAPSGSHYNLNIIGVSKNKSPNMDAAGGNVIFVGLGTKDATATTKILLSQAATGVFAVLDKNGTDGEASFELPAPGSYTIWARELAKPGGTSTMTTCASDTLTVTGPDASTVCSTTQTVFVRGTGKSSFRNVTTNLTTITLDAATATTLGCTSTTVSLFDPCLQGYFWNYDNNGLKLLQLRFYPNP
ncbi:MAG TPA: hypothetical protein VIW28_12280 [Gemmatimonadales bacterium]|jgi:hypothetical protein